MNYAYLHLAINHLPIVGMGLGVLLLLIALARRDDGILRGALIVLIVAGLGTVPAVQSGERAEDQVEDLQGTNEDAIHDHEEQAEAAQWVSLGTVLVAVVAFAGLGSAGRLKRWLPALKVVAVFASLVAFAMMLRVAQLGARIRHAEVRPGLWSAPSADP